jgi:drug/metabolite transporter (DMT)-like permease
VNESPSIQTATPVIASAHPMRGYLYAAGAAVLWGFSGVVTKYLLRRQLTPQELLVFRTTLSALILFSWFGLRAPELLRIERKHLFHLALLGGIGLAMNQGFYYLSLTMVSVGYSLLLQYLAPVHLMVYGLLSKSERMTGGKLAAVLMAIFGCILMVAGQEGGLARVSMVGTFCALGSGICFAFYSAFGKHLLRHYDSRTILSYMFLFSSLLWLCIRPPWTIGWRAIDARLWLFFLYLAVVATILPFALYSASLRHLEASRASLTSMLEPVVAALVAWLWLSETLTAMQIGGGAAVLAGVLLLQIENVMLLRARFRERAAVR